MAVYTALKEPPGGSNWQHEIGWIYTFNTTELTITNIDSTLTKAFGFFVPDVLNGGLLGGTIHALQRTSANGSIVYETITGLTLNALAFVSSDTKFALVFAGADTLIGGDHDQILRGRGDNDQLFGGDGVDQLDGGPGADTMTGGASGDTYRVDDPGDVIIEYDDGGADTVYTALASYTLPAHVETLNFDGSFLHHGTGNAGDNFIHGSTQADKLYGLDGNDFLIGGGGADELHGGAGDDTAVFTFAFAACMGFDDGQSIEVAWPPSQSRYLHDVEHLQFTDGTLHVNDGNALFDTFYYMRTNLDVFHAGVNALQHFSGPGWHEGRDPNAWFDTSGYVAVNPSSVRTGMNPLEHYHAVGWKQGLDPAASFDTTLYLINNPDVKAAGIDPLAHFLRHGYSEGRASYKAVGTIINNGFDAQYYLFHNPDVAAAGVDPWVHYNISGWQEGRDPNGWFDTSGYLAHYTDVAKAEINPLTHYMLTGWTEGRDPSTEFDTQGYLAANTDVADAAVNPLQHFLQHGIYEGRSAMGDGQWF